MCVSLGIRPPCAARSPLTRLGCVVQVLLEEGQGADQVWGLGRVGQLAGHKLPGRAAHLEEPRGEVEFARV